MNGQKKSFFLQLAVAGTAAAIFAAILLTVDGNIGRAVGDDEPPKISGILVDPVSATTTVITWKTDEPAQGMVNFGLDRRYGTVRDPVPNKKVHEIHIPDLDPSTTYYVRQLATDESGNRTISDDLTFTTPGTKKVSVIEKISEEEQRTLFQKALELLEKVKDPKAIELLLERLQELGEEKIGAPKIIGLPKVEDVGDDFAIVSWVTDIEANSVVELAPENEYREGSENPYIIHEGDEEERVVQHRVRVAGLKPATKYHFRVSSKGPVGQEGVSPDDIFTTKAILPQIISVSLQKVQEDSATIFVSTNIPTSAVVEYTDLGTKQAKSKGDPTFLTSHAVQLVDLRLGATYSAVMKVENEAGDVESSKPIQFTTVRDVVPAAISKVNNESTLFPGDDIKIQTIVSWETDEPARCQFFFHAGLIASEDQIASSPEEADPTQKHVQVITSLAPSSVYKFWIECADRSDNKSRSEDFVLITPEKEKSIIDIIIDNFQGTFGWLKNIKG